MSLKAKIKKFLEPKPLTVTDCKIDIGVTSLVIAFTLFVTIYILLDPFKKIPFFALFEYPKFILAILFVCPIPIFLVGIRRAWRKMKELQAKETRT